MKPLCGSNLLKLLGVVLMMFLLTSCFTICTSCEGIPPDTIVQDGAVDPVWQCRDDPAFNGPGDQCWGTSFTPPGGYYHKKGCNSNPNKWCENQYVGTANASCDCIPF